MWLTTYEIYRRLDCHRQTVPLVAKRYGWRKRKLAGSRNEHEFNVTLDQLNNALDGNGKKFIKYDTSYTQDCTKTVR